MDDGAQFGNFWIEEINGKVQTSVRKRRKYKHKKKEYNGWGSTSLIIFLESIGRDTSDKITQSEVTKIISDYVNQNNLLHPTKKKRIVCDERLHLLFGRKSISRLKISDLLESHFVENCGESSEDIIFDSEDDEYASVCETPKSTSSERKSQPRKHVVEKPRSCFAAINPFNIKLVYLRKSLVEELLKDPETCEMKVVGSFIRIKCDPNDYLQKNSHQLLQITGIKKISGVDGEIRLRASGFIKDIRVHMLSDDDFSEEECEDLQRRVKDGLLKRPMIVDLEEQARLLHQDMTKHWLARELALLQNLIDRANEKGWRRELDGYLQKRAKLKSPEEQERLLHEIPRVIADDLESESTTPDALDKKVEINHQELPQTTTPVVPDKKVEINFQQLSRTMTPVVPDKKVEINFQEFSHTTFTKASVATEVSKEVVLDFACKPTKRYEKLQSSDEQEWLFQETPGVTTDYLESVSKTPEVPDKKAENNTQGFWETTFTKASVLTEVPKAVSNGFAFKATKLYVADLTKQESESPKSILSLSRPSDVPLFNMALNSTALNCISHDTSAVPHWSAMPVQQQPVKQTDSAYKNNGASIPAESNEAKIKAKISQKPLDKPIRPTQIQVIELSDDDDEENEKPSTIKPVPAEDLHSSMWHYRDPQGQVQGPFSITSLKCWSDARYFSPDFKVWRAGQSQHQSVLLVDVLPKYFPR